MLWYLARYSIRPIDTIKHQAKTITVGTQRNKVNHKISYFSEYTNKTNNLNNTNYFKFYKYTEVNANNFFGNDLYQRNIIFS